MIADANVNFICDNCGQHSQVRFTQHATPGRLVAHGFMCPGCSWQQTVSLNYSNSRSNFLSTSVTYPQQELPPEHVNARSGPISYDELGLMIRNEARQSLNTDEARNWAWSGMNLSEQREMALDAARTPQMVSQQHEANQDMQNKLAAMYKQANKVLTGMYSSKELSEEKKIEEWKKKERRKVSLL